MVKDSIIVRGNLNQGQLLLSNIGNSIFSSVERKQVFKNTTELLLRKMLMQNANKCLSNTTELFMESGTGLDLLVREGNEDVFLSAGPKGHVFLPIVEPVVAGL